MHVLQQVNNLYGFTVRGTDGDIGRVRGIFFDDQDWAVRFVMVDTELSLNSRWMLIAATAMQPPLWEDKALPVALSRNEVAASPRLDEPGGPQPTPTSVYENQAPAGAWAVATEAGARPVYSFAGRLVDSHAVVRALRHAAPEWEHSSAQLLGAGEVMGYDIYARDGHVGRLMGLWASDVDWRLRFLAIDTREMAVNRPALVVMDRVQRIGWPQPRIYVDLDREDIQASPQVSADQAPTSEQETALQEYYAGLERAPSALPSAPLRARFPRWIVAAAASAGAIVATAAVLYVARRAA